MTSAVARNSEKKLREALGQRMLLELRQQIAQTLLQAKGEQGPAGPQGTKGDKPAHRWVGTSLQFELPDGTWGELVDLRGPRGSKGASGGSGGGSGLSISGDLALPVLDADYMIIQRGGRLYRITVELLKDVSGGALPTGDALLTEAGDRLITEAGDPLVLD